MWTLEVLRWTLEVPMWIWSLEVLRRTLEVLRWTPEVLGVTLGVLSQDFGQHVAGTFFCYTEVTKALYLLAVRKQLPLQSPNRQRRAWRPPTAKAWQLQPTMRP